MFPRLLERFEIGQKVVDLVRLELESGHVGVAGIDALGECFLKRVYRVALVQGPERRRDLERAFGPTVNRMAARAVGACIGLAALRSIRCGERRSSQEQPNQAVAQRGLKHGNWPRRTLDEE